MIKFKVNRIIKFLLLSDFIFWTGWGLVSPIFAIFIVQDIKGGNELAVGVATAIYTALSTLLRIPMGIFLDSRAREKSDLYFAIIGLLIASLACFGFAFASALWHIYLLQAVHAIGMAMNLAGWTALYTRHMDKGRESTEWGISAVSVGIGGALAAVAGGWGADRFGFDLMFAGVGFLGIAGAATLLFIRKELDKIIGHGLYFSIKELTRRIGE